MRINLEKFVTNLAVKYIESGFWMLFNDTSYGRLGTIRLTDGELFVEIVAKGERLRHHNDFFYGMYIVRVTSTCYADKSFRIRLDEPDTFFFYDLCDEYDKHWYVDSPEEAENAALKRKERAIAKGYHDDCHLCVHASEKAYRKILAKVQQTKGYKSKHLEDIESVTRFVDFHTGQKHGRTFYAVTFAKGQPYVSNKYSF